MIVKELRQGLRTWVFAGAFITLQMVLVLTLALTAAAGNSSGASWFFWWLIGLVLIGIMPLRGFSALADEIKMQTLDLLVLTRLSAWRIAFGKWVALISQSALLTLSILPYVVLRYYHGGVDPFREIAGLYLLWLLSSGLTAVIVCFSSQRSLILRLAVLGAIAFAVLPALIFVILTTIEPTGFFGMTQPFSGVGWVIAVTAAWAYFCYYLLEMGAAVIAPAAANHAFRNRLVALAATLIVLVIRLAAGSRDHAGAWSSLLIAILGLAWLHCLTEPPVFLASMFRPFVRRGWGGRLAAHFLTPGWHTGLAYYGLTAVACLLIMQGGPADLFGIFNDGAVLNAMVSLPFALAVVLGVLRRTTQLLGPFILVCVICAAYGSLVRVMAEVSNDGVAAWFSVVSPLSAMIGAGADSGAHRAAILSTSVLIGGVALVYLLARAIPLHRRLSETMRLAASDETAATKSPA
jgi:hypothetical protein